MMNALSCLIYFSDILIYWFLFEWTNLYNELYDDDDSDDKKIMIMIIIMIMMMMMILTMIIKEIIIIIIIIVITTIIIIVTIIIIMINITAALGFLVQEDYHPLHPELGGMAITHMASILHLPNSQGKFSYIQVMCISDLLLYWFWML